MLIKKRMIALLTALTLVAAAPLSGCGKGEDAGKSTGQQATKDSGGREMVGNMYTAGTPIVKNKVTFKLTSLKDPRQQNFNDMDFFKKLEEKTNVHIEWELIDSGSFSQKKNLILASGQYPDAFFMGISVDDVASYGPQGVLIKLNDFIDKYGENIKAAFSQKPLYKKVTTYADGNIYSLGSAGEDECNYNPDQFFIYKPWLDKLELKVPTTLDEFYTVLKAFKEKDPNGNGKADEIPFSFRFNNSIQGIGSLFGAFGRVDTTDHLVVENGKVVFTADKQEYKEAIIYFNKLFKEGMFDAEGFTQDIKQYFAKGKTQEVTLGSFMLWNAQNMAGSERAKEYTAVAPLKGPSGKQSWTKYNSNNGVITGAQFSITSACKNPEILVRWVDQLYDKKTSIEGVWGPVEEGANGMLKFVAVPSGMSFDEFRYKNVPVWPPAAVFAEDYNKVVEVPSAMKEKLDIMKNIYSKYQTSETLPGLTYTKQESDWNTSTGNDINNYVNDMQSRWLLNGGIEQEWGSYIAKLKQLKIDEHIKMKQTAYDRFMNTK